MNKFRGPHKRIFAYLLENGPRNRYDIRMSMSALSAGEVNKAINIMVHKNILIERDGLLRLNDEVVK